MEKKLITVLCVARSGSNFFCDFIDKCFQDVCVNYELFNKFVCCPKVGLTEELKTLYNCENLHEVISLSPPMQLINNIKSICDESNVLFKLFLDHLNESDTKTILSQSSIVIILKRNFLDIYISNEKAMLLKTWSKKSTNDIRIVFDYKQYENQKVYYEKLYNLYETYLQDSSIPYVTIQYEDFHKLSLQEQKVYVRDIVALNLRDTHPDFCYEKQDTTTDYRDKIVNYEEFQDYFQMAHILHQT